MSPQGGLLSGKEGLWKGVRVGERGMFGPSLTRRESRKEQMMAETVKQNEGSKETE